MTQCVESCVVFDVLSLPYIHLLCDIRQFVGRLMPTVAMALALFFELMNWWLRSSYKFETYIVTRFWRCEARIWTEVNVYAPTNNTLVHSCVRTIMTDFSGQSRHDVWVQLCTSASICTNLYGRNDCSYGTILLDIYTPFQLPDSIHRSSIFGSKRSKVNDTVCDHVLCSVECLFGVGKSGYSFLHRVRASLSST